MRLTVLTDNTARIDAYYLAEAGVSYYIQDGGKNILFDTGYSDVYVRNAEAMQIDLRQLDTIIFSHGHNDYTGGLHYLPEDIKGIRILAHPDAFTPAPRFIIRFRSKSSAWEMSWKSCNSV